MFSNDSRRNLHRTTVFLEGKNHDLYLSRATFIPAGSNSNDPCFFPRALIGSSTASNGITIFLKSIKSTLLLIVFGLTVYGIRLLPKKAPGGKNSFQMIIFRSFLCVRSRNLGGSIS